MVHKSTSKSKSDRQQTGRPKLYEFGGFDMQWGYYTKAGRKAASCSSCGVQTRDWQRPLQARFKKLPYDFNDTFDDKVILSARAKAHIETYWPNQMEIRQIFKNAWEAEPKRVLFVDNPADVISYSSEFRSDVEAPCTDCGRYYCQTFKNLQFRFKNAELIEEDGIFRTDVSFGHAFRSPLWLAGPKAAYGISAAFREVWLRGFEQKNGVLWEYHHGDPFRVPSIPDAVEPTYPDYLE